MTRMQNANRFKLGLFAMNCSGSFATTAPERWQAGWEENLEAASLADEAGFEFILPVARWLGYGGTHYSAIATGKSGIKGTY